MTHTVIGMFDSDFNAQDAVDELISQGFDRKDIDVNNQRDVKGDTTVVHDKEHEEKNESGIVRFFKNLFGDDDDDADKYSTVALKSGAVITVYANSEEEAGRAADILDEKGAFDVDEQATKYGYTPKTSASRRSEREEGAPTMKMPGEPSHTPADHGASRPHTDRKRDENANLTSTENAHETPNRAVTSGPGVSSIPTGGKRSKSRIIEYRGQESARLREDRDNETRFW